MENQEFYKSIPIVRQNVGKARTRFNILLKGLQLRYQRILFKNKIIKKYSTDDSFLRCIFRMEDNRIKISHKQRPFVNPVTREISTYEHIKSQYKILDWKCAFCKSDIKCNVESYDTENFTCGKCYKYYIKNSSTISQLVLDSMLSFGDMYKKILKEDQQKFIKYVKRNERKAALLQ